nr:flavodoxin [Lachnospiraceae bacterium]
CTITPITVTGKKYPSSYADTVSVAGKELREDARPAVEDIDISGYDRIILVYPIWWGTVPMPVATFLENNDFTGKTLYLLASQGSAGFGSSTKDIKKMAAGADVIEGLSIYCDDITGARSTIGEWLEEILVSH